MFKQYTLKNKVTVILIPQNDTTSITSLVMYPVGSRYEAEKMRGVSHYIEHLMFKGTKKRKNTLILTREIDRLGAEYNAFTGKEYTGYYIKVDAEFTSTALDILGDMLFGSVFDPKEMEREKGPIVEELKMYRDNPLMNIDNIFEDLLFDGSSLGRDIGGTEAHVLGFKRPDVLEYKKKFYDPSNMTLVLAGNLSDDIESRVEIFFGKEKTVYKPSRTFKPFCLGSDKKEDRIIVQHKAVDQAQLMIGFPGLAYGHHDQAALDVMNTIFGGSMSSRLFIQIRERRGLAYTVRSGSETFRDTGYTFVRAGVDPKNLNKTIRVVLAEIEKIVTKSVTARELADAKTHIRGALALSLEDSSKQASWYAEQALFFPKMKTPEEYVADIEAVSAADIKRVAANLLMLGKMRIAVIGNVQKSYIKF